jgi:hypothetical protein
MMRADEISTLKLESQKLQARALDGSTQPHCKHVFVTGAFCAADASTPVRSDVGRIASVMKKQAENASAKTRMRHHFSIFCGERDERRRGLRVTQKQNAGRMPCGSGSHSQGKPALPIPNLG